ncbi:MAG TPA: serine/threonine-protein kinase, partial [Urbifossiella sp.]|nr:serine/threonine-protein kinase [Urbifossiella sp.]
MVRNDCPAPHVLSAFNLGLLDDGEIETVGAHLDDCPACRGRLADPAPADPVCRLVRRADQAEAETPEAGLLRAEELVGRLDADSTARTRGGTSVAGPPPHADLAAEAGEVLAPPEAPGEIGRLGPFRVLEVIGCGGMGVVFRAADPRLGRTVAVKVLRPHAARQPELRDRFLAEARAVAAVRHDHVIPIYEIGAAAGRPYFVMAFVEGGTLAGELAAGPLEPRRAARLMREAAEAVAFSRARGIVHRDLKPGNVLLDAAGRAVVTDFGLAKRTDLGDADVTLAGQVMGTPNYMPPEQAQGRGAEVGPPADVYALGATLYALLTGRPPFQAATPLETLRQVVELDPVPPRAVNPAVPRDLDTVCMTCLRKEPANRYPSAAAVADELGRYLDGKPILARPVGRLERARKWARRNPAVAASLAGVVGVFLAAFALVTWSYLRADQAREDEAGQRQTAEANERAEQWGRYRANIAAASAALRLQNSGAARRALDDAPPEHR